MYFPRHENRSSRVVCMPVYHKNVYQSRTASDLKSHSNRSRSLSKLKLYMTGCTRRGLKMGAQCRLWKATALHVKCFVHSNVCLQICKIRNVALQLHIPVPDRFNRLQTLHISRPRIEVVPKVEKLHTSRGFYTQLYPLSIAIDREGMNHEALLSIKIAIFCLPG